MISCRNLRATSYSTYLPKDKGSNQRDLSIKSNYLVFFKNPRDRAQIQYVARQVYPEDSKFVQEAYAVACGKPHGCCSTKSRIHRTNFAHAFFPTTSYSTRSCLNFQVSINTPGSKVFKAVRAVPRCGKHPK